MTKKIFQALGLESIKFQSPVFFNELTMLYNAVREANMTESQLIKSDEIKAIGRCIKHHTGLNAFIEVENGGPAVIIPMVNKNHPFVEEWVREFFDDSDVYHAMKKAGGTVKGSVNLKNARVDGVFSEIESKIMMPYAWLMGHNGVTSEENAAVTLHEIGHLFTYYEYISRSTTTNQVLAALHRGYMDADSIDKRTAILISAKKALQLKQEGIEELAKSSNAEVVSSVIITDMIEKSRSELGANIYDLNSWEYLADEFAARHQAGRHLITGLDKIYKTFGHMSYRTKAIYIWMEGVKLSMLIGSLLTLGTPFGMGFMLYGIYMISSDSDVEIYDEPEARMRRIKQQIIQAMKDKRLPKDEIIRMEEDLKTIDTIMVKVKDKRQWFDLLCEYISPTRRKNRNTVQLQQELEKLANNELFAKAAQFKTLEV